MSSLLSNDFITGILKYLWGFLKFESQISGSRLNKSLSGVRVYITQVIKTGNGTGVWDKQLVFR